MPSVIDVVIGIALALAMVFLFVVGVGYLIGAEEISCNALWCEFKLPTQTEIYQSCYQDGHQVNCSEMLDDINQSQLIASE